jgi:hypothetical protein
MVSQMSGDAHSLQSVIGGGVAVLHESEMSAHCPAGTLLHESVRVQQVPGVPEVGATPGAPVPLSTQSWLAPHGTLTSLLPQPSDKSVPHCPGYDAAVLGVQHVPVVPFGGAPPPPVFVQTPVPQAQLRSFAPQPSASACPHSPA